MSHLAVTLIDVGWGDSLFLESIDSNNVHHYGLVDSNDTTYNLSSYIFIKRYFERHSVDLKTKPVFDFIMLSHAHSDHGQGLKRILKEFGARNFWYPYSMNWSSLIALMAFCNKTKPLIPQCAIYAGSPLPSFGDASMKVLWPLDKSSSLSRKNENNNSIVLALELGNVSFLLTGDAEDAVWSQIIDQVPANTLFFKVPHHGSVNGAFDTTGNPSWFNRVHNNNLHYGISSHVKPFSHPDQQVINLFNSNHVDKLYRTDLNYHVTMLTEGSKVIARYSH